MSNLWNYLNSPELVFSVQRFFGVEKVEKDDKKKFRVGNSFFHYLFLLGTELGDELFYGIFIPFFFFNIDVSIGRRFVFHWFLNMYVGQALKEVFKEERPKAPAIQMQSKWSNEYSLPSTHAMGSLSIATTIVYFATERFSLNIYVGLIAIVLWVSVISMSRVYLGMHSVLDLVLGVTISVVLLAVILPLTDGILDFMATTSYSAFPILLIPILLIVFFPTTEMWTPTRGDTCCIAAVFSGIELGVWFNYQFGLMSLNDAPYQLTFDLGDPLYLAGRTVVGLIIVALTEFLGKLFSYPFLSNLVGADPKKLKESENSVKNTNKNFVDLTSKFFTYSVLGFNTVVLVPVALQYVNLQRDNFYSQI